MSKGLSERVSIIIEAQNKASAAFNELRAQVGASFADMQQQYHKRLAVVTQSYQREVLAAQEAMRKRMVATQTSGEVDAVRQLYEKQVAIARAARDQQVALARDAHLASTAGMRPAIGGMDELAKTGARTGITMNTLRGGMTSLANTAVGTLAPGVATVTSALGGMLAGSTVMVGVLGGVAALGFAWDRLTAKSRELKKGIQEALAEIDKLGERQRFAGVGGDSAKQLGIALGQAEKSRLDYLASLRGRNEMVGGQVVYIAPSDAAIADAKAQWDKAVERVRIAQTEITEFQNDKIREQQENLSQGWALGLAERERLQNVNKEHLEQQAKDVRDMVDRIVEQYARIDESIKGIVLAPAFKVWRAQTLSEARFSQAIGKPAISTNAKGERSSTQAHWLNLQEQGFAMPDLSPGSTLKSFDDMIAEMQASTTGGVGSLAELADAFNRTRDSAAQFRDVVGNAVGQALVNTFVQFGESIGKAFTGADGAFKGLLASIMDMLGGILIAAGTTIVLTDEAFLKLKASLSSFGGGGIVAGLALITAGGLMKAGASHFLSNPTGSGSSYNSSSFDAAAQVASTQREAVIVLKGSWKTMMQDPDAQDSFAHLIERLSGRRIIMQEG